MKKTERDLQAAFDAEFQGTARFFRPAEVRYLGQSNAPGERAAGLNRMPPARLWTNILPTLQMADALRELYGKPLRILSGYRSEAYNKKIGGEPNSFHTRFMAMDLAPMSGAPGEARRLYGCAMVLRNKGVLTGGIGKYSWGVHIDCGPQREW